MKRYMQPLLTAVILTTSLLSISLLSSKAWAANEITRLVPFQGRLHGSDNKAVADGVYDITFYIYDTPTGGTALWTENHTQVSVIHGYINVLLGALEPLDNANFATQAPKYNASKSKVNFAENKYLGISINGGAEMFPRSQLVPTFHAYTANHAEHTTHADNADRLGGQPASSYVSVDTANSIVNGYAADMAARFNGTVAKNSDNLDGFDSTEFMRLEEDGNDFYGLQLPSGDTSGWVRTTVKGLIPFSPGNSYLGSQYWNFANIYGVNIYDDNVRLEEKYLGINAKSKDSDKLDGLNSTDFIRTNRNKDLVPIGTVIMWPSSNAGSIPAGYLRCDGSTLRTRDYPALESVLRTTYGGSSGSTFKLPNYQGLFLRGWGNAGAGNKYDPEKYRSIKTVQTDSFKSHTHQSDRLEYIENSSQPMRTWDRKRSSRYVKQTSSATGGSETRPKNIGILYLIKAI